MMDFATGPAHENAGGIFRGNPHSLFRELLPPALPLSPFIKHRYSMAVPDRCINKLISRILLKDTTIAKVEEFVKDTCSEWYDIPPGFRFRGITILLPRPMPVGFKRKKKKILMPFVKPCFGPMLVELDASDGDFELLKGQSETAA